MGAVKGLAIAIALTGCSFQPGQLQGGTDDAGGSGTDGGSGSGSGNGDAGTDSSGVACMNFTPQANPAHLSPCAVPPGPAYTLSNAAVYDTTTGTMVSLSPTPPSTVINGMRVISVDSFTMNATMRVGGTMPLVILSWSTITINDTLDLSSERTGGFQVIGAGARETNATVGADNQDCGGGGGGGFGTVGGDGGTGKSGSNAGGMGGGAAATPTVVVGGRAGAYGGDSGFSRGAGGAGGGAVQLTARQAIIVNSAGRIHAGGAGGEGGNGDGGGGGGGAGGYIGLDAPTVTLNSAAILAANGGGGGTGCDGGNGPEGENGQLGTSTAAGGAANTCATARAGGSGGANTTAAGFGASSSQSGGGGGGGVGFILVWAQTLTNMAVVSPAVTQP